MTPAQALLREVCGILAPPPKLTVSEFADRELRVTAGPHAGAHWRTDFAPYQRGIMDAFHEPGVELVVVMCSSQVGKTACATNVVAYHIAHDPCPILFVAPTVDPMAKDFARNRLDTIVAASPILAATVSKKRSRGAANTTLEKTFVGGFIGIVGANSAASLAARSIRLLILDEIDRFPAELPGEGATIQVALKRTSSFGNRRRVMLSSSPTVVGAPIDSWFKRGDQRYYYVPCPGCGSMHKYQWANVVWDNDDPTTARLVCPDEQCGYEINEAERVEILALGEWVSENPGHEAKIVSFHMWAAYSPMSSLEEIVADFLEARKHQKSGDHSLMHTWQNTTLGEPYEIDAGELVDKDILLNRREDYGGAEVPEGACLLTMGVDTQDDRLELLVVAWGPGEESWIVDRQRLGGDPVDPGVWKLLDSYLEREYVHATGQRLPIVATSIDSGGHRTDNVYAYCHRQAARRVYACKGNDGERPIVSSPSEPRRGKKKGRKVPLWHVGVDSAKELFLTRLRKEEMSGPGCVHIPLEEWADAELMAQLTSEVLVTRWTKGVPKKVWRQLRARNEALDCYVLATHAMRTLNANLDVLHQDLLEPPPPPPPAPKSDRKPFLGKRRKGFLHSR